MKKAPPPQPQLPQEIPESATRRTPRSPSPLQRFMASLGKSPFFVISLLIHLALVLALSTWVMFEAVSDESIFEGGEPGSGFIAEAQEAPTQPVQQPAVATPQVQVTSPSVVPQSTNIDAITTSALSTTSFSIPAYSAVAPPKTSGQLAAPPPSTNFGALDKAGAARIGAFTSGWTTGQRGTGTGGWKQRKFKFTAFLAKYSGGDWDSTVTLSKGKIVGGSLPNLLFFMKKFSSDRIEADPNPVPLDLGSGEIFTVKPPFIFFTGRRDFKLSDIEVQNLRKYVMSGGALWGDGSLPGRRSRFDIAFRREMRRVLPDVDKDFEPLPAGHPIYASGYFPEIRSIPPGLNFYQEPIEVLRIYGEIAVIYTINDYGDMWQIGLNEKGEIDLRRDANRNYVAVNRDFYHRRGVYFRNLTPESLMAAYKFGTNVVTHLLVRWENPLRRAGTGL